MNDSGLSRDRRTKILMLTDSFLPHAGGSREYYYNIYKTLVELGDSEVTILTKKVPGWKEFDQKASTEYFRIKRKYKPLPSLKIKELPKGMGSFLHTLWHVFRESPAIIHAGDLFPPGLIAMTLKKVLGLRYVVYCHGEEITQTDKYRYQPRVRDKIYKNADAVVANSEFAKHQLLRIGVEEQRIYKITPGVNASVFQSRTCGDALRKKYGLEGKVVILTVARLVPRKGHRAALQAFAKICHELPEVRYLIVGTGPDEPILRRLVQDLGVGDRVIFAGYVGSDQLPDVYGMCDVMLMPNRQEENGDVEGFGIVFLEANAAGTPVIGGRSGGAIEAIADGVTGFLVNPDDPVEIADILRRLLLDRELREKLGASGERRVWSDFNWEPRAEVLREINRNILTRHGKQTASNGKSQPVSETFADEGDHQAAAGSKFAE